MTQRHGDPGDGSAGPDGELYVRRLQARHADRRSPDERRAQNDPDRLRPGRSAAGGEAQHHGGRQRRDLYLHLR